MTTEQTNLDWALTYAENGIAVFPILSKDQPLTQHGWKDASTDPKTVRSWWTERPHAGVAIATGPSGLLVVDVDTKSGLASAEEARQVLDLPDTFTVQTQSGGWHLYYRAPEDTDLPNTAGKLHFGVDTRGSRGYVVAPPTPGYEILRNDELHPAPAHVVDVLTARPTANCVPAVLSDQTSPYGRRALEGEVATVLTAPEGRRNDQLNRSAFAIGRLVAGGQVDQSEAVGALVRAAVGAGLSAAEASEENVIRMMRDGESFPRAPEPRAETGSFPNPKTYGTVDPQNAPRPVKLGRRMSSVKAEQTSWLWKPRIPLGKLTLLAGVQGLGKSYVTMSLAADVSAGRVLPDHEGELVWGEVLIAAYEDGAEDTLRPRLDKLDADLDRIICLEPEDAQGKRRAFRPEDIPALEHLLADSPGVRLMIIDPITSFQGGKIDQNAGNEVRSSLEPLVDLAARWKIAVVAVAHLNKAEMSDAIYRVSGSVAYTALPRSVLMVGREPESGRKSLIHVKSNLGRCGDPVEFAIDETGFHWLGVANDLGVDAVLAAKKPGRPKQKEASDAADWLLLFLRSGPKASAQVFKVGAGRGFSEATLERVKKDIGVRSIRPPGSLDGQSWLWSLPPEEDE